MLQITSPTAALAGLLLTALSLHAQFASSVVHYSPGTGVNTNYIDPTSVLGEPSRLTPDPFGGPVDPFSPPWQAGQLVALGTNSALTVKFDSPIRNHPANPFGIDFVVFGNAGFVITNGNFVGGGITDGSLFGANTGNSRVSVSTDGVTFHLLNPALAPPFDSLFPTDGTGDFQMPVDPSLRGSDFGGRDLSGIRARYGGSGGGAGFDIGWAENASGEGVVLTEISFVRLEVIDGLAEIDALAAVRAPTGLETTIVETFDADPILRGWQTVGSPELFRWDAVAQSLQVTWDSSKPNSYFRRSVGTVLNRNDDFSVAFDLRLQEVIGGVNTNRPSAFPLSIGLQNSANASSATFDRTTGTSSPNLVEFTFFPDTGFGPTVWPAIWATNSTLNYNGASDFAIFDLPVGVTMRITMEYTATNSTLITSLTTNGVPAVTLNPIRLTSAFTDFRVDSFVISSYESTGPDSPFAGSLLARGTVDNINVTVPPPPISSLRGGFVDGRWQVTFSSRMNWRYMLEATHDFKTWSTVSSPVNGTGSAMMLLDSSTSAPGERFYRVRADRME